MLIYWSLAFFILAVVAGFLGFAGFARAAATAGKILFFLFLVLFGVAMLLRYLRRFHK